VAPASEAAGDDQAYRIVVELPGVAEEDIDLSVNDGVVTVKGEKRAEREEKGETWYFSERQYGAFARSFRLPPDADPADVNAGLKDGVLTVRVGKRAPKRRGGRPENRHRQGLKPAGASGQPCQRSTSASGARVVRKLLAGWSGSAYPKAMAHSTTRVSGRLKNRCISGA